MRPITYAAAIAAFSLAATAASAVTIVQYDQDNGSASLRLTNGVGGSFTLAADGGVQPVRITLFDPADAGNTLDVLGQLRFSAVGDQAAVVAGNTVFQDFTSGVFSLTSQAPVSFLGRSGTNILSGSFTSGTLSGQLRGLSSTFYVTVPTAELVSTSDFYLPDRFFLSNFSLGLSDANRGLRVGTNGRIANFVASSTGTFGAFDTGGSPSGIPEPATWAMMIIGFGLVGATARRRQSGPAHVSA